MYAGISRYFTWYKTIQTFNKKKKRYIVGDMRIFFLQLADESIRSRRSETEDSVTVLGGVKTGVRSRTG